MAEEPPPAQSAEDRKAASALASLSPPTDDTPPSTNDSINPDAIAKATKLSSSHTPAPAPTKKKIVKVDPEDVALLVEQLDLVKARATELLKSHDGDAVAVLRAFASGGLTA